MPVTSAPASVGTRHRSPRGGRCPPDAPSVHGRRHDVVAVLHSKSMVISWLASVISTSSGVALSVYQAAYLAVGLPSGQITLPVTTPR